MQNNKTLCVHELRDSKILKIITSPVNELKDCDIRMTEEVQTIADGYAQFLNAGSCAATPSSGVGRFEQSPCAANAHRSRTRVSQQQHLAHSI